MHVPHYEFICAPPVVPLLKFTSSSRVSCLSVQLFICMSLFHIMYFYARLHLHPTVFVSLRNFFTYVHSLLEFLTGYTFVLCQRVLRFCTWRVLLYCVLTCVNPSLYFCLFLSVKRKKKFVWCLLDICLN
jgi:hypothetical protein